MDIQPIEQQRKSIHAMTCYLLLKDATKVEKFPRTNWLSNLIVRIQRSHRHTWRRLLNKLNDDETTRLSSKKPIHRGIKNHDCVDVCYLFSIGKLDQNREKIESSITLPRPALHIVCTDDIELKSDS